MDDCDSAKELIFYGATMRERCYSVITSNLNIDASGAESFALTVGNFLPPCPGDRLLTVLWKQLIDTKVCTCIPRERNHIKRIFDSSLQAFQIFCIPI